MNKYRQRKTLTVNEWVVVVLVFGGLFGFCWHNYNMTPVEVIIAGLDFASLLLKTWKGG